MKKSILSSHLILLCLITLSGCATLKSVSVTRVPQDRSKPVNAEAWGWGILGLYFDNDFVDEAVKNLDEQCQNGRISGVMTKYSNKFYFLWTTRTINASGYCLAGNSK
jgi:lipoprotein NlpI